MIKSLLTFLFFYIGNDKEIVEFICNNCLSIKELIAIILDNKSKEILNSLIESASSINLILNPEEDDDEN